MELKAFIEEAICQIAEGAVSANERILKLGACVSPTTKDNGQVVSQEGNPGDKRVQMLEINTAITIEAKDGKSAVLSVFSGLIGGAAKADVQTMEKAISSVKITIPIALPHSGDWKKYANEL